MKDVARRKFKWNEAAVQDNLNENHQGVTITDLNNYRACGKKGADGRLDNYFKQLFGTAEPPLDVDRCICGHYIQELCYVCPIDDVRVERIITVGNECINKFEDGIMKGRRCEVCNATHKNRNFNLCNEHKKCKQTVSIKFTKLYNQLIARVRGINKYKARKYIYNSRQKHLLRFCFNTLKVDTKNVYKWKGLISNLSEQQQQNDILNPITKIIKDKAFLLNKIFNMFKATSYLKYFKESDNVKPLPSDFQKNISYVLSHKHTIFPYGKLSGKTFEEFYKLSDYSYKKYFLESKTPNNITILLQDYIINYYILEKAGYTLI